MGFGKLKKGLAKTRSNMFGKLGDLFSGKVKLDVETLEEIEEILISSDLGVKTSTRIVSNIEKRLKEAGGEADLESVLEVIRNDISDTLTSAKPKKQSASWELATGKGKKKQDIEPIPDAPRVIFVVGVNGTGKTTSIGKLAAHLKANGETVLVAAADTFRAAAVAQLKLWSERVGVDCIQQGQNADPAAVVFDAISAAKARNINTVIVDTAGRLHTKTNLMDELGKVARVIISKTGTLPETLLVVDANTGHNGLQQAKSFTETVPVDGLFLTKLDGTARGGIVVAIAEDLGVPVKYIGVGEQVDDIAEFDADAFAETLFSISDANQS
ncbi:MAG: signal recognition particle-docking protein FtsY [bacterium]|nr:signal recognition particle-docking protein FtsY [bacterium]MCP4800221.1 signal recognition particle-docking protein FtsY [bacterium]